MSAPSSTPSIAELRAATQPASIFARNSGEHWAGRLYVRRFSPYLTRTLVPTRVTPERRHVGDDRGRRGRGRRARRCPGVIAAAAAALLIQGQILLDCTDGELARWRKQFSPAGIYLDRLRALPDRDAAADRARHPRRRRLGRARHLHDARARGGRAGADGADGERARPRRARRGGQAGGRGHGRGRRAARLRPARGCAGRPGSSRSSARSWRSRRRCSRSWPRCSTWRSATSRRRGVLVIALVPVAAITAVGHLLAILSSERLR